MRLNTLSPSRDHRVRECRMLRRHFCKAVRVSLAEAVRAGGPVTRIGGTSRLEMGRKEARLEEASLCDMASQKLPLDFERRELRG